MSIDGKVLSGIRVVDFTTMAAAPSGTRIMADWGADVIKVENTFGGEIWRHMGGVLRTPAKEEENPLWEIANANKRAISLNLKTPEGKEILHKLLKTADVFVTSIRLEALKKLGLDYETLAERYPKLVYAHLSGFGEKGPEAKKPGYDTIAFWGRLGHMTDLAESGRPPIDFPTAMGDFVTGSSLVGGICAALLKRNRTGRGDKVSISIFGTSIWTSSCVVAAAQDRYGYNPPTSRLKPMAPLKLAYKCKDNEWIFLTIPEHEKLWGRFCKVIEREDLIDDKRFDTLSASIKHGGELVPILDEAFAKKTCDEMLKQLKEVDIPCDRLAHCNELTKDEQAWANDYLHEFTFANGEKAVLARTPVQFDEMGVPTYNPAPLLGEHSKEILEELGYSSNEIDEMNKNKVIKIR